MIRVVREIRVVRGIRGDPEKKTWLEKMDISAKMCILSQPFGMVLRYSYVTAPEKGKVEQVK